MKTRLTALELHNQFKEIVSNFKPSSWHLAIFEGSPIEGLYSWCPDCVVASTHVANFEKYQEKVQLLKFKVGSKREWESKTKLNPFKAKFPFLSDIPTAILFMGRLDVFRVIAPQETDLRIMCERIDAYNRQIETAQWHPPIRLRK